MKNESLSGDFCDTAENTTGAGKKIKFPLGERKKPFPNSHLEDITNFFKDCKVPGKKKVQSKCDMKHLSIFKVGLGRTWKNLENHGHRNLSRKIRKTQ